MSRPVAAFFLGLVLVACGGGRTITGTFALVDPDVVYSASSCSGTGGYSDIREGLGVVVKDGDGTIIGTSRLVYEYDLSSESTCAFSFSVEVKSASFYEVEVGTRGSLTYSEAELEASNWDVFFTLGG